MLHSFDVLFITSYICILSCIHHILYLRSVENNTHTHANDFQSFDAPVLCSRLTILIKELWREW